MEYAIDKLKKQIINLVADAFGGKIDKNQLEITVPPDSELGDLAVPCFYLSKLSRRSPNQIADELAKKIRPTGAIGAVSNAGPYLNFFILPAIFGRETLKQIGRQKFDFGRIDAGREKLMIEFSQPNTHKEFHIGHLRNVLIGDSLVRLNRFANKQVMPVNYIGDIGAHVAKCLWALSKFHQNEKPPKNKGRYLGQIYTEGVKKTEANAGFKKEADEVLVKLEKGDRRLTALWRKTRKWSLAEFDEIYKTLGVNFDEVFYESEVEKPGKKIVSELLRQGIAEKSEGAIIVNLEKYGLKAFLLLKSDGSSLYATKDLALAKMKFKKYKIDKSIVISDSRQSFYFKQLIKTLELIGLKKPTVHIPYEFVTLKEGAMSSRAGNVVLFEDFFAQVAAQATIETKKRHSDWPDKKIEAVAKSIALSAIKFQMLKTDNGNIIVFDIDEALSFDGFSGPYIQYTVSRISSVIKKAGRRPSSANFSKLTLALEKELILKLAEFPEAVSRAVKRSEPSEIAKYLFDLAKLFSAFYQAVPILHSERAVKQARLCLIDSVRQVLINGLELLGLEAMREM